MTNEIQIQERADRLVKNEVIYCVSSLVYELAQKDGPLFDQAMELVYPVPDYESAAYDEGWRGPFVNEADGFTYFKKTDEDGPRFSDNETWRELCDEERIDPYDREVFEHWIVSNWLADKLEEHGERIDHDFAGLTIWARTTTGQGISIDSVILDIAKECLGAIA